MGAGCRNETPENQGFAGGHDTLHAFSSSVSMPSMAQPKRSHAKSGTATSGRAAGAAAGAARAAAPRSGSPVILTTAQSRFLRGQAHDLKAMLQVGGKGVTDAVITEVGEALEHHELVKVKISAEDREARDAMIGELANRSGAALVQRIGHVAILYRPSEDHRRIVLPKG
jgi:RNA-binding protein